jgi:citrate lyase beta subunit
VDACNEIYSPTDAEIERARRLLSVDGVARMEGEMVDEASRRLAESVLARAGTIERGPTSA